MHYNHIPNSELIELKFEYIYQIAVLNFIFYRVVYINPICLPVISWQVDFDILVNISCAIVLRREDFSISQNCETVRLQSVLREWLLWLFALHLGQGYGRDFQRGFPRGLDHGLLYCLHVKLTKVVTG